MKKLLFILFGIVLYYISSYVLMGYGHTETHVPLNTSIGLRFLELTSLNPTQIPKFKNYEFNWNNGQQPSLKGSAITKDYYLSYSTADEVEQSNEPLEWIAKGGSLEDEPWGPASICYFYDPKGIDNGKKYLTDNSGKVEFLVSIPKEWYSRDAKSWATSLTENRYGWRKAKEYVVKALKESDTEIRKKNMALAYRCLGQSLHLVSDMGCPPHVRNDSHPPVFSFLVGDPDPYEDICKKLDTYTLVKANLPSPQLKSKFSSTEKFDDIFEALAVYTNGNFFSGGTIYSDRIKPIVRPDNPYPTPLMTDADYDKTNFTYSKMYDGVKVKMCKDKTTSGFLTLLGAGAVRGRPYLDAECVESMASVLMPDVVEAGANVVRLFVPSLTMVITEAKLDSGGIVRGKVAYTLPSFDDEYSGLFDMNDMYNGPVSLFINGTDTKIITVATKNYFEFKLNGKITGLKKDDIALTKLEFGGIVLKSDEKKVGSSNVLTFIKACKYITFQINAKANYSDGTTDWASLPGLLDNFDHRDQKTYLPVAWSGGAFSITRNFADTSYPFFKYNYTLTGLIQEDGTVTNCSLIYSDSDKYNISVKVEGIKVTMINPVANGAVYMELDAKKADPNGILKELTFYHPDHGTVKSLVAQTLFVQLSFRPSY